ncbi:MAG: serine/threonine protein kinase, partial [Clostridia bacterium]|nr:serine/threonine protein kinase [Clostridia bacterium]
MYKRQASLRRRVSIKVLRPEFAHDEAVVARFRREAEAVARLSHPNIVALYDVGRDGDVLYLVMEYVDGESLKERLRREGPMEPADAVRVVLQVLEALAHAHAHGVVHRDIKPHNILVTDGLHVKVTDFGIARAVDHATIVHTGTIIGSAHYFSPEQARGRMADARSDLYSTGVVLYELLSGRVPFQGDSPVSVAVQHVQEPPPPLEDVRPGLPEGLGAIVRKALAKDPAQRYQTAAGFRDDLEAWLRGETVPVSPPAPAEDDTVFLAPATAGARRAPPRRRRGRRRAWLAVLGGVLGGVAALAAAGWFTLGVWLAVPEVTVPNVRGMALVDAVQELKAAGLEGR